MAQKKTHQEFLEEVYRIVGEEYEVIGEYINTSEKILMRHTDCEHIYLVAPNKFLNGRRCPECSKKKGKQKQTKTHQQFVNEVYNLVGEEYEVLSLYIKSKEKVEFRHKACGTVFKMQPSNFLSGQRCKECSNKEATKNQRHTTEKFINDLFELVGDEYTVLGEYVNNHTDILIKHNVCNHNYLVRPSNFKGGKRCPKCQKRLRRTPQMYREDIYELYGDEYIILGDFRNNKTVVRTRHNKCGYEWDAIPSNMLRGRGCPQCAGNLLKVHKEFVKEVSDLVGNEYAVIGEYVNSKTKILIKHNICGSEFMAYPTKFVGSEQTRCYECSIKIRAEKRTKTTEEFKKELFIRFGDDYTVLGEYSGYREGILVRHNPCGEEYVKAPVALMRRNCKICSDLAQLKTNEEFIQEVNELVGDEYTVLGEYKGSYEKVKMRHNTCRYEWDANPHKFVNTGRRCPICNESKGETEIRRFLEFNQIGFVTQFKIDECRLQKPLPFDFAIFRNDNLLVLIEYDGKQHFEPIETFGGLKAYLEQKERDTIKDKFCQENNIKLIRIPYFKFNKIKEILTDALIEFSLLSE